MTSDTGRTSDTAPATPSEAASIKPVGQINPASDNPPSYAELSRDQQTGNEDTPKNEPFLSFSNSRIDFHNRETLAQRKARRKLVGKYDFHIMPIVFLSFFFFFLDKSSIAYARIHGLENDLRLTNHQFNIALSLFFVLNLLFNIPGNLLLRRIGGRLWLSSLIIAWGVVTVSSGFIMDFAGLCITRVFLGLTESSFLGGVLIYLGFFYTRNELILRVGIFYSSSPLAAAFGGLLASGLGQIRLNGFNGWPWIFFIEGALTVVLGVIALLLLPNTPYNAGFLTPDDRPLAIERMRVQDQGHYLEKNHPSGADPESVPQSDASVQKDRLQLAMVKRAIWNFMTIIMSIGAFFAIQQIYSFALFLPSLIFAMGYKAKQASLMAVWPNLSGFFFTLGFCWFARRGNNTIVPMVICSTFGMVGYCLLLNGGLMDATRTQYVGTFFVAASVNALPPLALTWMTVNASPHYVRAIALGFMLTIGNLAAFLASFTYIRTDAPAYTRGHAINLGCACGLILIGIVVPLWMYNENRRRDRGGRDYRLHPDRYSGMAKEDYELQLGWLHPKYRFKY